MSHTTGDADNGIIERGMPDFPVMRLSKAALPDLSLVLSTSLS